MSSTNDPTALDQTFNYTSSTHTYSIAWTSLGSPTSPPLIFIHGTPWSSRVWIPFALALSRQYHVYLFDNPGFGDSSLEVEIADSPFESSDEVERLDADLSRQSSVFAALYKSWEPSWNNQKPHIIAHDHAGLMSLRAFLLHNCIYASLCLIDVVALSSPDGPQPLFKTIASNPSFFLELPDNTFDGILESYIRDAAYTKLSDATMEMLKAPWLRKGGKEGFVRQLCQANSRSIEEVEGRYAEVGKSIPVRIIWGIEDEWIPVETAERLGKVLGTSDVSKIDDAGHLVMYDQPAQLGVELGSWLWSVSS
jgi:pimeloyl-ACP methyl ester carboxylesterase